MLRSFCVGITAMPLYLASLRTAIQQSLLEATILLMKGDQFLFLQGLMSLQPQFVPLCLK